MGARSPEIDVNPEVLVWARTTIGYSLEEAAGKIGINPEGLAKWETGESRPTLTKLRSASTAYKRSLAALLYPEAPKETPLPRDFRKLPGKVSGQLSTRTRLAIRRTRRMQSIADELFSDLKFEGTVPVINFRRRHNPEAIASEIRENLGLTVEEQFKQKRSELAFRMWRNKLEGQNILIAQESMPMTDSRGFSLAHEHVPAIVVNTQDTTNGKIFTLFHEYAHLLIRREGICLPRETEDNQIGNVESFCNAFAGAFLVPKTSLLSFIEAEELVIIDGKDVDDQSLNKLTNGFCVSREVILRRLLEVNLIDNSLYQDKINQIIAGYRNKKPGKPRAGNRAQRSLRESGRKYVVAVFEASEKQMITHAEALEFLSIRTSDMPELKAMVME